LQDATSTLPKDCKKKLLLQKIFALKAMVKCQNYFRKLIGNIFQATGQHLSWPQSQFPPIYLSNARQGFGKIGSSCTASTSLARH
jgi:hypothetical protein